MMVLQLLVPVRRHGSPCDGLPRRSNISEIEQTKFLKSEIEYAAKNDANIRSRHSYEQGNYQGEARERGGN